MTAAEATHLRTPLASESREPDTRAEQHDSTKQVEETIGVRGKRRWKSLLRWALVLLVLGGLITALWLWRAQAQKVVLHWHTQPVTRGDLRVTIDATGTLEPETQVIVGAEVSGKIAEVAVEENDPVVVGQVLARFDRESFESELAEAQASLAAARADVRRARASLVNARAEAKRTASLYREGVASAEERETRESALAVAEADLGRAQAQSKLAQARVEQLETRLGKTVVTSPIDGVVLRRNVEPGNTVAATFQSPELFTIAADLSKMQLELEIDEADVGRIAPGQRASFVVDAWPEREFEARVEKVALAPTITGNVVSYVAELSVANVEAERSYLLRPGMTATATIHVGTHEDVLRVPTIALRFNPPQAEEQGFRFGPPPTKQRHASGSAVWVLRGEAPVRVAITTGPHEGEWTEVVAGELELGDEVVVGLEQEGGG